MNAADMTIEPEDTYPIPHCWVEHYKVFAEREGFSKFPTYESLERESIKALLFIIWINKQLKTTTENCRGYDKTDCKKCVKNGFAQDVAMATLAKVVRDVCPGTSFVLEMIAHELGYKPEEHEPEMPDDPNKSPALVMPIPKTQIFTNAASKKR